MRGMGRGWCRTLPIVVIAASLAGCDTMWDWGPEPPVHHAALAPLPPPGSLGRAHPDSIVVKPGQTLFDVARLYDIPTRAVIDANHLEPPYRLIAGRTLVLPQIKTHLVHAGDTIYSVARTYGVQASTLVATNHLQPPYTIFSGTVLVLPPQAASSGGYSASIVATPLPPPGQGAPQPSATMAAQSAPLPPVPPPAQRPMPPQQSAGGGITATPLAPPSAPPAPVAQPPVSGPQVLAPAPTVPPAPSPPTAGLPPPPAAALPSAPAPAPAPAVTAPAPTPSDQTASLSLPPPPPRSGRSFLWPVQGEVLSKYGPMSGGTQNDGINIKAPEGTPVLAADAGTVAYAGNELRGYGNLILIKHADGWMTAYAHNSRLLVTRGQKVQRGQVIARVGATGAVTEPQLHFEVRRGSR